MWFYGYLKGLSPREELAAPCTMNLFRGYFNSSPSPRMSPSRAGEARTPPQRHVLGHSPMQTRSTWWKWELFLWVVSSGPHSADRTEQNKKWFKVKVLQTRVPLRSLPPSSSQGRDILLLSPAPQARLCRSWDLDQWGPAVIHRLDLLFTWKTSALHPFKNETLIWNKFLLNT